MRPLPSVIATALVVALFPRAVRPQEWHPGRSIDLIRRAVAYRQARDADTLLAGWHATATGTLRFTSVLHQDNGPIEQVIRADELQVEVYGAPPNRSKQFITFWRDTTFLPNHLIYHRDHLGIVANDFGPLIRLGEGDEVRDVVHPLSDAGLDRYLFRVGDTLSLAAAGSRVRVVLIDVRPRDRDSAGTVGTIYLDVDRSQLIRFDFTFTPSSYRDRSVAGITVSLENALESGTLWLPWRQSLAIRRADPLFDFPVESVIRADWTIDDYQLGLHLAPSFFEGRFISGPLVPATTGPWKRPIAEALDSLPPADADVDRITDRAAASLGGEVLSGMPRWRIAGMGISDFVHVNRVEGVATAGGLHHAFRQDLAATLRGGYGWSDHQFFGDGALRWTQGGVAWSIAGGRSIRDVGDQPVISGLVNSVATLESGVDAGDYTRVDDVTLGVHHSGKQYQFGITAAWERSASMPAVFMPISGAVAPNPALGIGAAAVVRGTWTRGSVDRSGWTLDVEGGAGARRWVRAHLRDVARFALPSGDLRIVTDAGIGSDSLPPYRAFVAGGRETLPGLGFRSIGGRRLLWSEISWEIPAALPTPSFPYSRYVRLPTVIAPFVGAGVAGGNFPGMPWVATDRIEPVAGVRFDLWGPLFRIETGISLRTGRVEVTADASPVWWPLL